MSREDFRLAREAIDAVKTIEGASETWANLEVQWCVSRGLDPLEFLRRAIVPHPYSLGLRLVFMRNLLAVGAEAEALPQVEILDELGSAEAALCMGIYHSRRGKFADALVCMRRSLGRDPSSRRAAEQVQDLERLLAAEGGNGRTL
jgi:hypothetical protein